MNKTRFAILAATAAGFAATIPAVAEAQRYWRPPGWQIIGFKTVERRRDTDNVYAPGRQDFRRIQLCVYNAPLRMRDLRVYFRNGRSQDVRVRSTIRPNSCTRAIDLIGRDRDITRIRMKYDPIYRGTLPIVRIAAR